VEKQAVTMPNPLLRSDHYPRITSQVLSEWSNFRAEPCFREICVYVRTLALLSCHGCASISELQNSSLKYGFPDTPSSVRSLLTYLPTERSRS
jgi:hypothetical protein